MPDHGNVMCVELKGADNFVTIEISDNDGKHKPKKIRLDKESLMMLSNVLESASNLLEW